MIQGFLTHGIDPWFFILYGIYPWFFTHSHLVFFLFFLREWGYVARNVELPRIYGGMNNNVLDHFWWNLIVKVK